MVTTIFIYFAENQLTKFSARDAGDFSEAAGERETDPKCGSLSRDAGELVALSCQLTQVISRQWCVWSSRRINSTQLHYFNTHVVRFQYCPFVCSLERRSHC